MIKIVPNPDMMKFIEGKSMETFKKEASNKLSKVSAVDAFIAQSKLENNLDDFVTKQEIEDIKRIVKEPTGEEFEDIFQVALDEIKKIF